MLLSRSYNMSKVLPGGGTRAAGGNIAQSRYRLKTKEVVGGLSHTRLGGIGDWPLVPYVVLQRWFRFLEPPYDGPKRPLRFDADVVQASHPSPWDPSQVAQKAVASRQQRFAHHRPDPNAVSVQLRRVVEPNIHPSRPGRTSRVDQLFVLLLLACQEAYAVGLLHSREQG
jgi:hypothetical protein